MTGRRMSNFIGRDLGMMGLQSEGYFCQPLTWARHIVTSGVVDFVVGCGCLVTPESLALSEWMISVVSNICKVYVYLLLESQKQDNIQHIGQIFNINLFEIFLWSRHWLELVQAVIVCCCPKVHHLLIIKVTVPIVMLSWKYAPFLKGRFYEILDLSFPIFRIYWGIFYSKKEDSAIIKSCFGMLSNQPQMCVQNDMQR